MEISTSKSPTEIGLHHFYSLIKTGLFQLLCFLNSIYHKLIGGSSEEIEGKNLQGPEVKNLSQEVQKISKEDFTKKSEISKGISSIPGPISLPLFGTMFTSSALASKNLMKANEERYQKYGSIVKEEVYGNFPLIFVLDADDVEIAMKVMAQGYFRPGMHIIDTYRAMKPERFDSSGLVNSQGIVWEAVQKAFVPLISSPKYVQSMTTDSDKLAMDFISLLDKYGPVVHNLRDLLNKYVAEEGFLNVFGKRMGFLNDTQPKYLNSFIEANHKYWDAFQKSAYGMSWWKYFPTKVWTDYVKAEVSLNNAIEQAIEEAKADPTVGGIFRSMMDAKGMTENDKRVVTLELATGATEPVFCTALMILYFLSKDERVSKKIFEELKQVLPFKDSPIDENCLNRMPYLKACIQETHRISPATPNAVRVTEKDIQLGDYTIPKHSLVILQTWFAAVQDKAFYRAKEFLPERWIYKDNVPPYQPHRRNIIGNFGIGKRACPGRRAATLHLIILMARLFRKYEIHFENELQIEYEWLIAPVGPITVKFHERPENE